MKKKKIIQKIGYSGTGYVTYTNVKDAVTYTVHVTHDDVYPILLRHQSRFSNNYLLFSWKSNFLL